MNRYERRHSLRRKIQNSIFRSTLISHGFLACIVIPALLGLMIPIGQIMTRGVAFEIVQRYTMADVNKVQKAQLNASTLNTLNETALIEQVIKKHMLKKDPSLTEAQLEELSLQLGEIPAIMVDLSSNDLKRLIWVGSEQLQASNSFLISKSAF